MKWIAQVGHVARKDVRQTWGMLALYVVVIAFATQGILKGTAFGPYGLSNPKSHTETLAMPDSIVIVPSAILVLLAVFSVASLVQQDSPTRPNALWATRPLSSSAVLTSKLLLTMVGIIGVALLGGSVALASMDTNPIAMMRILLAAALSCLEGAIAVLIVSALTRDLREFVGVLAATSVGLFIVMIGVMDSVPPPSTTIAATIAALSVGSGLWFVTRLYLTRERRRSMWIVGVGIVAILMFAAFNVPQPQSDVPTLNSGAQIKIAPTNLGEWAIGIGLPIKLRITDSADSVRLDFRPDSVFLKLTSGTTLAEGSILPATVVAGALPWIGNAVRWINIDPATLEWPSTFTFNPYYPHRDSIAKLGVASFAVGGTVTVSRARLVASLPLREGAYVVKDGFRVRMYGTPNHSVSAAQVYVQLSSVPRPGTITQPEQHLQEQGNLQFALVNDSRNEAMLIDAASTASGGSGAAILPQIGLTTAFNMYSTTTAFSPKGRVPTDDNWYKNARLVVVEWVVVGSYRTMGEANMK